jgi:hypothetical protein
MTEGPSKRGAYQTLASSGLLAEYQAIGLLMRGGTISVAAQLVKLSGSDWKAGRKKTPD